MASGDEVKKSFSSDATRYMSGIVLRDVSTEQGTSDETAPYSTLTEKKKTKPAAHRSSVNAADTGDISSSTGNLDIANSIHVACYVDFDDPGAQAEICLALFDDSGTPDLIGITESNVFQGDASLRDGAEGPYVSPRYVFDVSGASRVRAIVKTLTTSAAVNIFLMPL